jgi:iron complex transport system permease protein
MRHYRGHISRKRRIDAGLFRNPIVEPGLIGTSSGAAFGASVVFVLAAKWTPQLKSQLGPFMTPLFAFGGALLATWLVYTLAKNAKRVSIISLLLIGIAVNAMGLSGTGFMSYIARDPQARALRSGISGLFPEQAGCRLVLLVQLQSLCLLSHFAIQNN